MVFLTACAVLGGVMQGRVGAQSSQDESQLRDNLKSFTNVYAIVEQNYAEPIAGDKADEAIYDGAIPGMLRVLDPHSNFYDPKAYSKMREDQRGHYYGVGMTIQQQSGKTFVVYPFEGTPSFRAGIHPGDQISAVDGKTTDGLTSDQVAKMLKGPRGTHVTVETIREGQPKPLQFDLIRDEIPHPSVDLVYEIRPGVGYVHLTQFTETSGREVNDAVDSFSNLKGLVLDLRGNPGGLLSQAVDICDHLLTKGQEIVSQRGRGNQSQEYWATHGNSGKTFPIVVLVDRNTASAAEIVSGALQDHDRALIVGETTFGKGLVQTVFDLQNHSMALALTTYHYYTPSGRLIQRDYSGVSLYDYYYNRAGAMPSNATNREVKLTDDGRTVYGGGGITPDEKIEIPKSTKLEDEIYIKSAYMHFAPRFLAFKTVDKNFVVDDAVMKDFKEYLRNDRKINFTDEEFKQAEDYIKTSLKSEIFTIQFGQKTGLRVLRDWDPVLQKALSFMPEAEELEQKAHKVQLQKAQARNEAP